MKKFHFRIGQKISGGFSTLVVISALTIIFIFISLQKSATIIRENGEVVRPSRDILNEFKLLATNSRMYTTNWIYLQTNAEDKEALKKLHEVEFPALKEKLNSLKKTWSDRQRLVLDSTLNNFDSLLTIEKMIMTELATFEDYEENSGLTKMENTTRLEGEVLPLSNKVMSQVDELLQQKSVEAQKADAEVLTASNSVQKVTIIVGVVLVLFGVSAALLLTRSITQPINHIRDVIQELSTGELPENRKLADSKDEIGEMAQAVDKLVVGLRSTSLFAASIGNGNYEAEHQPLSEKDVLGNALLEMRDNLKRVGDEDKRRNWATEGQARFGEILRRNSSDFKQLCDEIVSNLVKYTKSNQGGIFIINEEAGEPFLELKACYAWDKKKYLEQKIYVGEGLTGQAWQEGEKIYLTEVPDNYISITSGLGESNPRSVLIVPLKVNEQTYGVVEIASFYAFEEHHVEFVEKIAESIASTVASAKVNERTQRLLEDSTMLTEQMRAQEEEMRQNMEELQATQEEMQRAQRDTEAREHLFNATQLILEFDRNYRITYANQMAATQLRFDSSEMLGKSLETLVDTRGKMDQMKNLLSQGQIWLSLAAIKPKNGKPVTVKASAGALMDHYGQVVKYLMILDNISEWQVQLQQVNA